LKVAVGARRKTTQQTRESVYAAARYLDSETERELGVRIPFKVYAQDPPLAVENPDVGFEEIYVRWEPGIADGPTSARFAVVDFNGDTGQLAPKAEWQLTDECFLGPRAPGEPKPMSKKARTADLEKRRLGPENEESLETLQFHQVNVWVTLQRALAFFEAGTGLGRPIPFAFDGNRLIVVPHAGYGKNAFYDRSSKSLQFYFFDDAGERIYTCLSADIINHEFGHAVLDGVRPHLQESTFVETGAFHEFIGDLSAILILLRHRDFRRYLAEQTAGDLSAADQLAQIATQFGKAVSGKPYLRTARSRMTMDDVGPGDGPHKVSEVLTAAMFDILQALAKHYRGREQVRSRERIREIDARDDLDAKEKKERKQREPSRVANTAFWNAIQRMQSVAIQPLDLLPPVDVTFTDYAHAVLRADTLANPVDPHDHRKRMRSAFVNRGILSKAEAKRLAEPDHLFDRLNVRIFHDVGRISRSRSAAYEFLDDNREDLFIPSDQDIIVADLYDARKRTRQGRQLPRQIVLTYIWREQVELKGKRFGEYENQRTSLLCGGTLVLDDNGAVVSWTRKPGTQSGSGSGSEAEMRDGRTRLKELLNNLADRIAAGHVGATLGTSRGLLGSRIPPLTVRTDGDELQFQLSPHMRLEGEDQDYYTGGPQWEPSS
jgi:hypothetical protein